MGWIGYRVRTNNRKEAFKMRLKHKFMAKPVEDDGQWFGSTLEWKYFKHLKILQQYGEVLFFLRQVPFHLPGGVKYVVDYQVFYTNGDVVFVDVKGLETDSFKFKVKIVEDIYPVVIEVVKRGEF